MSEVHRDDNRRDVVEAWEEDGLGRGLRWSFETWRPLGEGDDHYHCTFCYYTALSDEEPTVHADGWANTREGWTAVRPTAIELGRVLIASRGFANGSTGLRPRQRRDWPAADAVFDGGVI